MKSIQVSRALQTINGKFKDNNDHPTVFDIIGCINAKYLIKCIWNKDAPSDKYMYTAMHTDYNFE